MKFLNRIAWFILIMNFLFPLGVIFYLAYQSADSSFCPMCAFPVIAPTLLAMLNGIIPAAFLASILLVVPAFRRQKSNLQTSLGLCLFLVPTVFAMVYANWYSNILGDYRVYDHVWWTIWK